MPRQLSDLTRNCGMWQCLDPKGEPAGHGSCFPITPRHVVTNHHVVVGSRTATVRFGEDEAYDIEGVVAWDDRRDLAIAELDVGGRPMTAVKLAKARPEVGSDLFAVGHPSGLSCTVSRGICSAMRTARDLESFGITGLKPRDTFLQMDAAISPGSSGGPIADASVRVVAVSSFGVGSGDGLNFGVPIEYVARLFQKRHLPMPLDEVYHEKTERMKQRTPVQHLMRLYWLMAGVDGSVDKREAKVVLDTAAALVEAGIFAADPVKQALQQGLDDVVNLNPSQFIRDSLVALRCDASVDDRAFFMNALESIAHGDGHVDSAEQEYWRLIANAWHDVSDDHRERVYANYVSGRKKWWRRFG